MHIQNNYLRWYRKRSQLTQADIGFILHVGDCSTISRAEKGIRAPSIEMLIVYHIMFDVPIEAIVKREKLELMKEVRRRVTLRIAELQQLPQDEKVSGRIAFLRSVLSKINPQ